MIKYVRIAVTALNLTVWVLLVAVWVRSYRQGEGFSLVVHGWCIEVQSEKGQLCGGAWPLGLAVPWRVDAYAVETLEHSPPILAFGYKQNGVTVFAPHWFATLVFTSLAAIPWIRRFSLRTLLIATTLLAVMLGIVVAAR